MLVWVVLRGVASLLLQASSRRFVDSSCSSCLACLHLVFILHLQIHCSTHQKHLRKHHVCLALAGVCGAEPCLSACGLLCSEPHVDGAALNCPPVTSPSPHLHDAEFARRRMK
ncbi:hypothetical protein GQ54DRAFT_35195 [Martensiomyces pterosporus]|nr:hypothetical protein GQ54DRAFT_35195 [Martensiomyces pterosporus]